MKVLIFEYITGGGLAGQELPSKLAAEGRMMLQALLEELTSLHEVKLVLPLDARCKDFSLPPNVQVLPVAKNDNIHSVLQELTGEVDMVWPIAPETGGTLAVIARQVKANNKILLASEPDTIALCGNKWDTYCKLKAFALPVVETLLFSEFKVRPFARSVIKPVDGVGCEGSLIQDGLSALKLPVGGPAAYLFQPFVDGQAISLSCLFKQGQAWLLSCNRQDVTVENRQFRLRNCLVNISTRYRAYYQRLIQQIAQAIPGLWGYVGIDLIESVDRGPLILEINPRLTTSYVGIGRATGINVAEQVLCLLKGEPELIFTDQQTIRVVIH
ncbi:ATP-grasp domain-containing protein [Methylomonas sp. MgM2]